MAEPKVPDVDPAQLERTVIYLEQYTYAGDLSAWGGLGSAERD